MDNIPQGTYTLRRYTLGRVIRTETYTQSYLYMYEAANKRSDIVTHETTSTKSDLHTKHGMKGHAHAMHTEGTYTWRGYIHGEGICTEGHTHGGHHGMRAGGTYTSRGDTHGRVINTVGHKYGKAYSQRDIHAKRPTHKATKHAHKGIYTDAK